MQTNRDYRDLLNALNGCGVRYLIIGGYAVMKYTEPYLTKDLDIWIDPTSGNARLAFAALASFGAPLEGISPDDLIAPDVIYQVGVHFNRVDVLSHVPGLAFDEAWSRRDSLDFGGVMAPVLSLEDLIASKRAAGRKRDRAAARALERSRSRRKPQ